MRSKRMRTALAALLLLLSASFLTACGNTAAAPTAAPRYTNGAITVYVTRTGAKYHRAGCRYLAKSQYAISLQDAVARGYTPCSVCRPPSLITWSVPPALDLLDVA